MCSPVVKKILIVRIYFSNILSMQVNLQSIDSFYDSESLEIKLFQTLSLVNRNKLLLVIFLKQINHRL